MTRTRYYRDLAAWQKSMALAMDIYRETEAMPKSEIYGLQSQIRRSAVSVPSNIAEGHGRLNDGHFRQFLANARGSLFELQTQLELASNLHFIASDKFEDLMKKSDEVARIINGLLATLRGN